MLKEPNIKVLVVDDDDEIRAILKTRLTREKSGFSVETVPSGEDCLEYLRSNRVDCIICDHQMGGMDGVTLLNTLRGAGNDTPLIFFTGQGNEEIAAEAFRAGAFDYFTKNLMGFAKFTRLANSVEQAVRQRIVDEYRAQAERELAAEKRKLEDLLFHLGVGLCTIDRDFRVTYQNSVHAGMVGESAGDYCYKAYEGRDSVCEGCPAELTFADGKPHKATRSLYNYGHEVTVELITTPITGPDGEVVSCIEVVEDLTELKIKEHALKHSELRFRSLFEGANDAILLADAETGEILDANARAGELLGVPRESLIGMHQSDLHPPEISEKSRKVFSSHASGPGGGLDVIPVKRSDGSTIPVEISGSTFELGGRKVQQGIFRDISERIKAEEKIRQSEARYREAERIAGIGSWEWDVAGDKVHWSDGMFRIFGVKPEDFGKTYQSYLDFVVPGDRERVMGLVAESLKGEAPLDYTTRFIRSDGEVRSLYIYGRVTLGEDGKPGRLFGTAQDVTEMRRSEEALKWELSLNRALSGLSAWLIDRTSSIEDLANVTLEYARSMTGSRHGFVSSVEQSEGGRRSMVLASMVGNGCAMKERSRQVDMIEGADGGYGSLFGKVMNTRTPFFTNNPSGHEAARGVPEGHIKIDNFLAVPSKIGDSLLGMIALANKEGGYTEDDLNLVSKLAEFYSLALERLQAEDEVRKSEMTLRTVLGALPDMVFVHERDGTITNAFHPEGARLYAPKEEFLGRGLAEVLPPDVADRAVEAIGRILDIREPEVLEYRLPMGGALFTYEARLVPFGEDSVLSVVRDVTENRRSEEALRMSEERFRQLADNIEGVPWMMSASRDTIYYVGPAYESIWGGDPAELAADPWSWLKNIHPDDRERVREQVINTPLDRRYGYECRIVKPDGRIRWVRNRVFPIVNDKDEVYRLAGIVDDITEEKNAQAQREDLLSMLRHDLRTPLSVIAGNAEMIAQEKRFCLDDDALNMLQAIQSGSRSLSRMLDDLSAIARLESGTMPLRTTDASADDLVLEVTANMAVPASEKGHILVREVEEGLPELRVDHNNVLRALINMVLNSVNYTTKSGEIAVGAHRSVIGGRPAVSFFVRDSGEGIPGDEQAHVFEKRFRASNSAGVKGSGLGLAIVKLVAEAHGGTVELESEPGAGSTFRMIIPVVP